MAGDFSCRSQVSSFKFTMLRRRQRTRKKPSRGKENKENTVRKQFRTPHRHATLELWFNNLTLCVCVCEKSPEVGGLEPQGQSTPVSSTLESLCGLGELDLPLAFNSIVHNSPITTAATTKNNRKRTHSPTPIRELSTDMPLRPHRLEAAYDLPIPPIRKRRPRPKQTKAKKVQQPSCSAYVILWPTTTLNGGMAYFRLVEYRRLHKSCTPGPYIVQ